MMPAPKISGLCLQPVTLRIEEWLAEGKLSDDDVERSLGSNGRAIVDHGLACSDWLPLDLAGTLVGLVAEQLGGETGLVDCAREIAIGWLDQPPLKELIESARALEDGPGFLLAHASECLLQGGSWQYEGGRGGFSVRLLGLDPAGPELRSLVASSLARLVELALDEDLDVRFSGIDASDLRIFGERLRPGLIDPTRASRLHRAALVPLG